MNRLYVPIFHWFLNSTQSKTTYLNTVWVQMLHFSTAAPLKVPQLIEFKLHYGCTFLHDTLWIPSFLYSIFFKRIFSLSKQVFPKLSSLSSFSKILEISPKCLKVHSPNFISLFILFSKIFHFCHLNFH